MTHIFGVACVAAFLLGEAVWWRRRGTVRWGVLAASSAAVSSGTVERGPGERIRAMGQSAGVSRVVGRAGKHVRQGGRGSVCRGCDLRSRGVVCRQDLPRRLRATVRARALGWEEMGMLAGLLCLPAVLVGASAVNHSQVFCAVRGCPRFRRSRCWFRGAPCGCFRGHACGRR